MGLKDCPRCSELAIIAMLLYIITRVLFSCIMTNENIPMRWPTGMRATVWGVITIQLASTDPRLAGNFMEPRRSATPPIRFPVAVQLGIHPLQFRHRMSST
jgi:hypothetical protein